MSLCLFYHQIRKILSGHLHFRRCKKKDISELKSASNFAKNLKSIDPNHPSSKAYFIHAIRVATHTLASLKKPNVEIVKMAMIHNVFDYIEKRGCIESKRLEFDELQKNRAIN